MEPDTPAPLPVEPQVDQDAKTTGATRARVLVADDDSAVRRFLRTVLEEAGYEVAEASDGRQAERGALDPGIDLLIIDLVMPNQEGIETIRDLRSRRPKLPILAISGAGDVMTYLNVARLLGAEECFAKPIIPATLLSAVRRSLQTQR
jgi:two-component system chemotaxis response regulator CheY